MARLLNFIGTAVIIIIIVLCLSLVVPKAFGITCYTVLTGSMEPALPVGSAVFVKATEPALLEVGDIIVFDDGMDAVPITHRVVENQTGKQQVITKGDANAADDIAPIPYCNIVGKVVLHLSGVSRLLAPLGTVMGKIAMFLVILAGFLLCEVARRLQKER